MGVPLQPMGILPSLRILAILLPGETPRITLLANFRLSLCYSIGGDPYTPRILSFALKKLCLSLSMRIHIFFLISGEPAPTTHCVLVFYC